MTRFLGMEADPEFDQQCMQLAWVAAVKSPDPSTQNGAVVTDRNDEVLSMSCNTFVDPRHFSDDRLVRPTKYTWIEHAERNAIYAAAKVRHHSTSGGTMYCLWAACPDCARGIIASGIRRLVTCEWTASQESSRWSEGIGISNEMFKAAGVQVDYWTEPVYGKDSLMFDGKEVRY